jgi:NADH dehydrogenase/NADH:ubiquinone oxidoreductase subunit G
MNTVTLEIDGKTVKAQEGTTVFQAAKKAGINIPSLCYHEKLEPYGACRLCMVEVTKGRGTKLVASCCYPVEDGLVVKTDSEKIHRIRKVIIELALPLAPLGPLLGLAKKYGIKETRFPLDKGVEPSYCILCGRCVRYCSEVKKQNAIGFVGRGVNRKVALVSGIGDICVECRECYDPSICEGGKFVPSAEEFAYPLYRSR